MRLDLLSQGHRYTKRLTCHCRTLACVCYSLCSVLKRLWGLLLPKLIPGNHLYLQRVCLRTGGIKEISSHDAPYGTGESSHADGCDRDTMSRVSPALSVRTRGAVEPTGDSTGCSPAGSRWAPCRPKLSSGGWERRGTSGFAESPASHRCSFSHLCT